MLLAWGILSCYVKVMDSTTDLSPHTCSFERYERGSKPSQILPIAISTSASVSAPGYSLFGSWHFCCIFFTSLNGGFEVLPRLKVRERSDNKFIDKLC